MQTCLNCRAALREFRAVPEGVASAVPPAALAVAGDGTGGSLRNLIESVLGAAQHKTAGMGERLHAAAEVPTGQKVAAVAASAAALGGGGTAVHELSDAKRPLREAHAQHHTHKPVKEEIPAELPATFDAPTPPADRPEPAPPAASTPAEAPPPPAPEPAKEFMPAPTPESAATAPFGTAGEFSGPGGGGSGTTGGEFAP